LPADVVFDHYLARDWQRYSAVPLHSHIDQVHHALAKHHDELPHSLQRFSVYLKEKNVLEANQTYSGVRDVLNRLSKRSPRFAPLADGGDVAFANEAILSEAFHALFAVSRFVCRLSRCC